MGMYMQMVNVASKAGVPDPTVLIRVKARYRTGILVTGAKSRKQTLWLGPHSLC